MGKPVKISGVVITFNEEKNLARCLESLKKVTDEIIVVDSFSTDGTEAIARHFGAVFIQHPFEGHIEQKNYAMGKASHDIILSLDGDEELSAALIQEITILKENWTADAYQINRLNQYGGHWVRHGGWYPDRKIRLFDRQLAHWGGDNPHDKIIMAEGTTIKRAKEDFLHYTYDPEDVLDVYTEHMNQINTIATLWAHAVYPRRKKVLPLWHLVLRPPLQFFYEYVFKLGFLDGYTGYILAKASAWNKYLKYLKLHGLYRAER